MEAILDLIKDMKLYLEDGGPVMLLLVALTFILWFGIAFRLLNIKRGSKKDLRVLLKEGLDKGFIKGNGFLITGINKAIDVRINHSGNIFHYLDEALFDLIEELGKYRSIVRTAVIIAPLAGLLGTVSGMIEMFDSLGSQTFYSQSGGIANGISQALFTTQFGLVVAIPGMLIGRAIDRREDSIKEEFDQLKEFLNCYKGGGNEIHS